MINYLKLYKKYFLLIIIFLYSCENKSISNFDKNIKELIDWSLEDESSYKSNDYIPITSNTLEHLITLQFNKNEILSESGIIIGYFIFKNNKIFITEDNKDFLILIARAQKYENFNILIQSNDIKSNLKDVMGEIKSILLSNGVKNNKISLESIDDKNNDYIIKIIKKAHS
ncbi:MAG: hypothetical protein ACJ0G9_03730 [Alphaproteobacteria bacterium]|nr:MAG: hypothetical protein DBW65_01950 [Alphaproteobacteria bacterium]|tara:strand:+ start:1211 stop:1723 length:513 start_codon:yes stop_codon:yes gene_type:complete